MPGSAPKPSARHRRTNPRRKLAFWAMVALSALALCPGVSPVGRAAAYGPNPISGFFTSDGFAVMSYQAIFEPVNINPGDLVFADLIYLQFVDFGPNRTVHLTTAQNISDGGGILYANATYSVTHGISNVTTIDFTLPSTTRVATTTFCIDDGCEVFQHQSPLTIIPSGVLNIGGLDLLVFSIGLETLIFTVISLLGARYLGHKALWSPRATMGTLLVLPHVTGLFLFALLTDYQLVDTLFSGAEFLIFPPAMVAFLFFWELHLFNVAEPALVQRMDPQGGHGLAANYWLIWVGERSDGTKILIGTGWGDWLARLFGHAPILVPANSDVSSGGAPAEVPVKFYTVGSQRIPDGTFRMRPGRASPLDSFRIRGMERATWKGMPMPKWLYFVESDRWLDTTMPRLTIHRDVRVEARTTRNGDLVPATTKTVLTWPHYTSVPSGKMALADFHYLDVPVAAVIWKSTERAYRKVGDLMNRVIALEANWRTLGIDLAEEQISENYRLLDRETSPLSDLEASEETVGPAGKKGDSAIHSVDEVASSPKPPSGMTSKGVKR